MPDTDPKTQAERPRDALNAAARETRPRDIQATVPPSSTAKPGAKSADLPETFGRYRILKLLGQGGMGSVFLAQDTQLERQVALKVPKFEASDGPEVLERFFREARAAATLHHPNICPIHDVGAIDGTHYLTMAYIEGKPLTDFIRAGKGMPAPQAAALVRKIALALDESHRHGIVHRDLKPANIMINQRKEPVIMDFGLARQTSKEEARITKSGAVVGTPAYMSPEQVTAKEVGPASDIYSLGVILYEMLTGKLPFDGPMMAVLSQILLDDPPPPSKHHPGLDPKLEAICLKALAKDPGKRQASMADLAAALGQILRAPAPAGAAAPATEIVAPTVSAVKKTATIQAPLHATAEEAPVETIAVLPAKKRKGKAKAQPLHLRPWPWIAAAAVIVGAIGIWLLTGVVFRVQTKNGVVELHINEPGAQVFVDEELKITLTSPSDKEPIRIEVPEGKHTMKVVKGGFVTETKEFTIRPGTPQEIRVVLRPVSEATGKTPPPVGQIRSFKGHKGAIWSLAVSPDGRHAVSGDGLVIGKKEIVPDYAVHYWDLETGQELKRLRGHTDTVRGVAFSPDGRRAVSASWDKTVRVWDLETGDELVCFTGHTDRVLAAVFTKDGTHVLSGGLDLTLRRWDAKTGKELKVIYTPQAATHRLVLTPEGDRFLCGANSPGSDKGVPIVATVSLWDLAKGQELFRFEGGHKGSIHTLDISADGSRAISGGTDYVMRVCDVKTGKQVISLVGHATAISRDGRRALGSNRDGGLVLWDLERGKEVHEFYDIGPASIAFLPDGIRALSGGSDSKLTLWQLPKPAQLPQVGQAKLRALDELNTTGWDAFPWLSDDGLTIYWEARAQGEADINKTNIWTASRKNLSSPFENKRVLLPGRHPSLTSDELRIVGTRADGSGEVPFEAVRSNRTAPFVETWKGQGKGKSFCLSADGLTLYYNMPLAPGAGTQITSMTRKSLRDPWDKKPPQLIDWEDPQTAKLTWPFVLPDGLTLLCCEEGAAGKLRMMVWTRTSVQAPFKSFRYLDVPGVGVLSGRSPRYVPQTRELFFTAPPNRADWSDPKWTNTHADLWVLENVDLPGGIEAKPPTPGTAKAYPKLADTTWINSNGVSFRWLADGSFLHGEKPRACVPIDAERVAILFADTHVDLLVFNKETTTFDQWNYRTPERPLFTGKRTSSTLGQELKRPPGNALINRLAGTKWKSSHGPTLEYAKDGTFRHDHAGRAGSFPYIPLDENRVLIVYKKHGHVYVLRFNKAFTAFEQFAGSQNDANSPMFTSVLLRDAKDTPPDPGIDLFNYKDFQGWQFLPGAKKSPLANAWQVDQTQQFNVCKALDDHSILASNSTYKDFRLELEWRIPVGGTVSKDGVGVFVRFQEEKSLAFQINNGSSAAVWVLGQEATPILGTTTAKFGNRLFKSAALGKLAAGEWHRLRIVCNGDKASFFVNENKAIELGTVEPIRGAIAFRSQGTELQLRKVRVKESAD